MTFNSIQYALFLPVVMLAYRKLGHRAQNLFLLAASYLFYGAWDWRFLSLLVVSTVVDFTVSQVLVSTDDERRRRVLLLVSIVTNLGILGFFKYFGFFTDSAAEALARLGWELATPTVQFLLPVGISFYTFQTLSYTIDVYRRRLDPERDLVTFALFVAFFPQLVAGPIERAQRLLPQLGSPRPAPSRDQLRSGALLILLGLFKKVAIADAVAPSVDAAFTGAATASWITLLIGVYGFALQIYADFSGYTDIARGSSRLLGIELMENFSQPYLSRTITGFWRTWHISLSSWLRDYLYIPLGGNRRGPRRTTINLLITMLLGGLWHGAAWTFVVWGALHGAFLAAHHRLRRGPEPAPAEPFRPSHLLPAVATFHLVCLAWVFFRASSVEQAVRYLAGIATLRFGDIDVTGAIPVLAGCMAILFLDLVQRNGREHTVMLRWPAPARGVFYAACVLGVVLFSGASPVPFIYFQF